MNHKLYMNVRKQDICGRNSIVTRICKFLRGIKMPKIPGVKLFDYARRNLAQLFYPQQQSCQMSDIREGPKLDAGEPAVVVAKVKEEPVEEEQEQEEQQQAAPAAEEPAAKKPKKPRTAKQIAATQRMLEARRRKKEEEQKGPQEEEEEEEVVHEPLPSTPKRRVFPEKVAADKYDYLRKLDLKRKAKRMEEKMIATKHKRRVYESMSSSSSSDSDSDDDDYHRKRRERRKWYNRNRRSRSKEEEEEDDMDDMIDESARMRGVSTPTPAPVPISEEQRKIQRLEALISGRR